MIKIKNPELESEPESHLSSLFLPKGILNIEEEDRKLRNTLLEDNLNQDAWTRGNSAVSDKMQPSMIMIIEGLPSDITEREFGTLFTFVEGFEGSEVHKHSLELTIGLAVFRSEQIATRIQKQLSTLRPFNEQLKIRIVNESDLANMPLLKTNLFQTVKTQAGRYPLGWTQRDTSRFAASFNNGLNMSFNTFVQPKSSNNSLSSSDNVQKIWSTPSSPQLSYKTSSDRFESSNSNGLQRENGLNRFLPLDTHNLRHNSISQFKFSSDQSESPTLFSTTSSPRASSEGYSTVPQSAGGVFNPLGKIGASIPSGMSTSQNAFHGHNMNNPAGLQDLNGKPRAFMPSVNTNPADQNPPCNTIYVGNLPQSTSEEELKSIFSRQRGYKRLCFRTKSNGPMCFVEFEDIEYATMAMNALQGYLLSTSVKGGIRLSYSKNPLGVRSSQNPANNQPQQAQSGLMQSAQQQHQMALKSVHGNVSALHIGANGSMHRFYQSPVTQVAGNGLSNGASQFYTTGKLPMTLDDSMTSGHFSPRSGFVSAVSTTQSMSTPPMSFAG